MNIFPDMCAHTKGFFIDGFFLTAEVEMFELNSREREREWRVVMAILEEAKVHFRAWE